MLIGSPNFMIIAKISGGLGNQIFQYAAGRSLAIANNCELKLDLSWFELFKLHNGYELSRFAIKAEIANTNEVFQLVRYQSRWVKALRKRIGLSNKAHFVEYGFSFCPDFMKLTQPVYIDGHWQSYKYFESISPIICTELEPINQLSDASLRIAEKITKVDAISVHVRRGDYLANKAINKVHGVIEVDYYMKAIQRIRKTIPSPHFFVFSDDLEWAINNLGLQDEGTFVSHNKGASSYEDMRLMNLCKHNIIANSSFSWWGAWLNQNKNKIVIYPKKWFNDPSKNISDLTPVTWISI